MVNAIKYNRSKGNISITDGFTQEHYFVSIADTGVGMNEEQLKKIFKRFTRINEEKEGHGLGLAIVDSIAHFHHIKMEVFSVPNEGTTFLLLFPKPHKT
jgi:signal transduction histidine kinase